MSKELYIDRDAAPELLEALEKARIALYDNAEAIGVPLDTLLAADIEHAIAKARGVTP